MTDSEFRQSCQGYPRVVVDAALKVRAVQGVEARTRVLEKVGADLLDGEAMSLCWLLAVKGVLSGWGADVMPPPR